MKFPITIQLDSKSEEEIIYQIGNKLRHIEEAIEDVKKGYWRREKFLGHNLDGKRIKFQWWFTHRLVGILIVFGTKIVLFRPDIILEYECENKNYFRAIQLFFRAILCQRKILKS